MKLSEFKDEEALDLLADILEPVISIAQDKAVERAYKGKEGSLIKAVQVALKSHKSEIITILAALEGVPVSEYHCSVLTLPQKIIEVIADPEIKSFFNYAASTLSGDNSGDATENTEDAASTL